MPRKKKTASDVRQNASESITSIKYDAKRKNIPPAGLEAQGVLKAAPKIRYEYNPHLPPVLRSAAKATEADKLPELLAIARQRALSAEEVGLLKEALSRHEPWLEWSGKREKPWFEVDPVALHMHDRISTQAILRVLAREDIERNLFADPQHDYAKAVQFYQHEMDWANRIILGDSLQVMASLARREDLTDKVQMIYFDPPYGIRFSSNFQPELGQREVNDREQDLTREPEMVKAYRDTWTLGVHSYLAYLRDRLAMARELLAETGSIFVQISDENLHRVRCVMDEVFGPDNIVVVITVKKKSSTSVWESVADYLLWYVKDRTKAKLRRLTAPATEPEDNDKFRRVQLPTGERRSSSLLSPEERRSLAACFVRDDYPIVSQDHSDTRSKDVVVQGKLVSPGKNKHWRHDPDVGMKRLEHSERIRAGDKTAFGVEFWGDSGMTVLSNVWSDTHGEADPIYVVQTNRRILERCLLMTTDPGDLVLDPTCGSGTTAFVSEQLGRRWITCDSSRVALALAKHRLMVAKFDYYQLRELNPEDVKRNPTGVWLTDPTGEIPGKATFKCDAFPQVGLGDIARNASLDPVFQKHEPIMVDRLEILNREVANVGTPLKERLVAKLIEKHREEGATAVTEADTRRWLLPGTSATLVRSYPTRKPLKGVTPKQAEAYRVAIPTHKWNTWEVPFDTDPDWPKSLQDALAAYRAAWRAKMDEVNACIRADAKLVEVVDSPKLVSGVVRVTGPFTMEGVIAVEEGVDTPICGAPDELDIFDGEMAVTNAEAHLDKIIRLLIASGVDFAKNKNMQFCRLDPLAGASLIHAEGEWMNGDKVERRVAVSIGPEVGNVSAMQVEDVIRDANRRGYDDVVFAGFGFDAAAQDAVESGSHPNLRLHMALIRPDVAMGDLLKTQPGSQLFTVFSAPRVKGPTQQADDEFTVEVEGMDVYDPVSNTLFPTNRERIAAWFLDTDYDGRTFCICQAFFPDKSKWEKLAKALGDADVIEEDAFDSLSGWTSLPFPRPERLGKGETWRVAVKVIDPRGNEGLRVLTIN